jgi:ribosomal protein S18 acetylase RimI-like enzyme
MAAHLLGCGIQHTEEESIARVMHKFECAEILLEGEKPVGLLKLHRGESTWEIVQFQLCPSVQGRGYGTTLMREIVREAGLVNATIRLSVLRANPARRLYESLGFTVIGGSATEHYMQLPPDNAFRRIAGTGHGVS